jgi:hypothetical protein
VESYHKYKYAIVYYYDFTSMAWVVCLRSTDQAFAATKQFVSYVRTQYNALIKGWRSDAGGEFTSKVFRDYLKDNGIHIHQSAPYAHQQNSRAERLIRTLTDKAQAMRLHACLPDSYWEFAILHAAHVYNMTLMNRLNWRTPLELLKGEKPSVSHRRIFGCGAYVHLPDETRKGKLQPKSQLMVYLGVSAGSEHNYLFMRPNNTLHTSAHDIFDEHLFPKCSGARPHKPVSHAPRIPHKDTPNGHESDPEVVDDDAALPAPPRQPPVVQPPVRTPSPTSPATPPPFSPAPVTPPRSHPPPIGPPPLRRGEWECCAPFRPGNIYGERGQPSKQVRDIERESTWKRLVGKEPLKAPDTPNVPGGLPPSPTPSEDDVDRLTREGGDALTSYLCLRAIPYAESVISPNYREWSYCDIQKLPTDEQALWRKACETELSMLKERNVWEVTDRPIDRKIIKNH